MIRRAWYERWEFLLLVAVLSTAPLLWPEVPPLVDLPGHLGRYRVELDHGSSALDRYFSFHWSLVGNLGVDLLIVPIAAAFGLEMGIKLIALLIPLLTVLGIFWTSREIHGRIPPTTIFAVPLVYGFPFNYGFLNFCLSMALALNAFALWLWLGRTSRARYRIPLFAPIAFLIWLTHAFGWAVLALMIWSSEFVETFDTGKSWSGAAYKASIASIPLGLPLPLMIAWRAGNSAATTAGFFQLGWKTYHLAASLRDRWLLFDTLSVAVLLVLIGAALFDSRLQISRRLAIPACALFICFLILPIKMFGSAYADARLAPFVLLLAVVAVRFEDSKETRNQNLVAVLACAFLGLRVAGNTISFAMADSDWKHELKALDRIPDGARVLSLIGVPCQQEWLLPRYSHLASFVIFRKYGFSNDQWEIPGAQLLRVDNAGAEPFRVDPSEVTYDMKTCAGLVAKLEGDIDPRSADDALAQVPQREFDFVWLIKPAGFTVKPRQKLQLVWSNGDSWLYRLVP